MKTTIRTRNNKHRAITSNVDAVEQPKPPVIVVDDEEEREQPAPKSGKIRGRRRNPNFLPYEEARDFVRGEMIPSRSKYEDWWDRNKPKSIPRFPYRVYKEEWVSWNDFLGTNNKFSEKVPTKWRTMLDAIAYVHTLKIKSSIEWMEWCRETGNLPSDIPARPDLVYSGWRSWSHWLGNSTHQVAQVQQERAKVQVFYVIRELGAPTNVINVGVDPSGISSMKERWMRDKFDVVGLFWYEPDRSDVITRIVNTTTVPYQGQDRERLAPNVWELIWQLSTVMDQIRRAD